MYSANLHKSETGSSSPEEVKQEIRAWWNDQENQDAIFVKFMPSERGWDKFQARVAEGLEEISFETPDREVLFDDE
ncbi:hypothetical protein GCM10009000_007440 [Halobacterium noricense]|uniref:Uncharacterized protein n=1 Tax=Haladaptatus pallidirubidus TaxID=1008152 RepID=A0AAV3UQE0_9EURY